MVRFAYDLAPFPRVGCDELLEFIRRPQNRLQQLRYQILLPQLGVAHNLAYVGIDLGDNFTGCFGWGEQTEPIRGFVPRHAALIYRRDVGKLWASFETAHRQYIDFPLLGRRQSHHWPKRNHLYVSSDQVIVGGGCSSV